MSRTLRRGLTSLSSLARSHDDLPAFNAAYWVLTLLAAMLFNAGAFALLIAGHIALDVYKYRDVHGKKWGKVAEGVVRENLLDASLLSLGIAFAVYCHSSLPIVAGLRGFLRTEIVVLNAIVQIAVKTRVLHGALSVLANARQHLERLHPRMGKGVSILEIVSFVGLVASVAMIVASPWILRLDAAQIAHLAEDILVPWNL